MGTPLMLHAERKRSVSPARRPECIGIALLFVLASAVAAFAQPMTLARVRSFEYAIAVVPHKSGIDAIIADSPSDLIILGGASYEVPLDRARIDPEHKKLIFCSVDTCEASPNWCPDLFGNGALPSWFGKLVPGYDDLYSVQFWNPRWKTRLFHLIDRIVASGYDGIFLDVLNGDNQWSEGNSLGNPVYSEGTSAMAALLSDIRAYVDKQKRNLGRPFFLIGNNPNTIGERFPDTLKNLDGIVNEVLFWAQRPDDGTVSEYIGTRHSQYVSSELASMYKRAGVPVFGVDYPVPLSDKEAVTRTFEFCSSIGWVSSVTHALQDARIFSSGPFLFTATPLNPVVVGTRDFVNYLSGGTCPVAVLTGGDQGDVFIGGTGRNTIRGGTGDDLIYAHPANVIFKNRLAITLMADVRDSPNPTITILVNGKVVQGPVPVTATFQNERTQEIVFDVPASETLETVELAGDTAPYVDQSRYANIQIVGFWFMGQPMDFSRAQYAKGSSILNKGTLAILNQKSTILFPHSAIPRPAVEFGTATDTIDGGRGTNTVVYRAASNNYTVTHLADGSYMITSKATNEGPDGLRNIQFVRFTDKTIALAR